MSGAWPLLGVCVSVCVKPKLLSAPFRAKRNLTDFKMVLDINLFRKDKGGNPDLIRESQRRRFKPVEIVDEIIALDEEWKQSKSHTVATGEGH